MWSMILGLVGSWLPGIGKTLVDGYKAKLSATNTSEHIAADLAGRELAVQQKEIEVQGDLRKAQIGHWYEPEHLMGYIATAYLAKLVIWDTMLGLGTTSALHGWADNTMTAIVLCYFGKRGFENVARILRR